MGLESALVLEESSNTVGRKCNTIKQWLRGLIGIMKCISMNSDGQSIITVELINKKGIDEICNNGTILSQWLLLL